LATMTIKETWGGIKFNWVNSNKEQVVVSVLEEINGEKLELDTYYSTEEFAKQAIRGLDTIPYHVAVTIRDVYGNSTDTIHTTKLPIFELMLPAKTDFKELPLSSKFTVSGYSNGWDKLWDGKTVSGSPIYYLGPASPQPYITIDLGKNYIFSRMKLWQRLQYVYTLHNARFFEIWGTGSAADAQNPDNWDGWRLLGSFESYKPSGNPAGGAITAEDIEHATVGEEFEFGEMTAPVRYIRLKSIENWSKSTALHLTELEFYGKAMQ